MQETEVSLYRPALAPVEICRGVPGFSKNLPQRGGLLMTADFASHIRKENKLHVGQDLTDFTFFTARESEQITQTCSFGNHHGASADHH